MWSTTARATNTTLTTGMPPGRSAVSRSKNGPSRTSRGGTTARESLATSDNPWYIDSVPSVTISTGRRRPTASTPLNSAEHGAEDDPEGGGEERVDPVADRQGGDDGREVEHPADRQVDLAHGDDEHHPQRQHADEGAARR